MITGACTAARQERTRFSNIKGYGSNARVASMNGVDGDPDEDHRPKRDQKFPTPAKFGDPVGESLAKREFPFELFNDVARKNLMPFQAFDDFLVEHGKFPDLVFQDFLDVILPKLAQIFEADERF